MANLLGMANQVHLGHNKACDLLPQDTADLTPLLVRETVRPLERMVGMLDCLCRTELKNGSCTR